MANKKIKGDELTTAISLSNAKIYTESKVESYIGNTGGITELKLVEEADGWTVVTNKINLTDQMPDATVIETYTIPSE